jgi:predicted RNA-binding protein with PIN domain
MALHFILDGYNVIHSDRRWTDLSRDKQREQFLRYLDQGSVLGSERNTITVVLDGYAAALKGIRLVKVKIVFSEDRDADTVIKEKVRSLKVPADAVVVTDDRAIQASVRRAGAQVMPCLEFFRKTGFTLRGRGKTEAEQNS